MSQFNKAALSVKHPSHERACANPAVTGGLRSNLWDFLVVLRSEDAEEPAHGDTCVIEVPQIHVGFW